MPLLVTLVNQSESEKHAVCIINHAGRMLVLDTEETFGLKLSREALAYCFGVGKTIKGVNSIAVVQFPPPRKEKQVAKPSVGSVSPESKKQKKDSGAGPSSKPRPSPAAVAEISLRLSPSLSLVVFQVLQRRPHRVVSVRRGRG